MDRERFDALARVIATQHSRRAVLTCLLGMIASGPATTTHAARRHGKTKGKSSRHRHRDQNQAAPRRQRQRRGATPEATACYPARACVLGKGTNAANCDFSGSTAFRGKNLAGANLSESNLSRIDATNASFKGANLHRACLVDANLTDATLAMANTTGATFCRTTMPGGSHNDSGCDQGTPCCPTCDADHLCAIDQVCCNGNCVTGECCDLGEQSICGASQLCCAHNCVVGECCRASDCPTETCQIKTCQDHRCAYEPVFARSGPRCANVCCQDGQGEPRCCPAEATTCDARGLCCQPDAKDTTCAVGTLTPKCGQVMNNCGQQEDCGGCAEKTCQTGSCTGADNTCAYKPVSGTAGPGCETVCCQDATKQPQCCDAGTTVCTTTGLCRCASERDCAAGEVCCDGTCRSAVWSNLAVFGGSGDDDDNFDQPIGVAIADDEQTVWVVDQGHSRVSVWKRENNVWKHQANFGEFGTQIFQFEFPFGVEVSGDGQSVWVGDQGNNRVSIWQKQLNGLWAAQTPFGQAGDDDDDLDRPTGVAIAEAGQTVTVWATDTGHDRVSIWSRQANGFWTHQDNFGQSGSDLGEFSDAVGVAVSDDGLTAWVVDRVNTNVSVWELENGAWVAKTRFGSFGDGADQFRGPLSVAVSKDGQSAWVPDLGHDRVSIWTRQANGAWAHQLNFGRTGTNLGEFDGPSGIAVSADGKTVWVTDVSNDRVSIWSLSGCPAS